MEKVVPFRTGYGSGLCAAWYDGSFLFVLFRLSSGADGHVSGTVDYDVFGKPVTETGVFAGSAGGFGGISALVFAYAGKPYDTVTGLSDYGFRDYAPTLARFTTVDPIRDGSNWYAYCNADPVNYVDMWGLKQVIAGDIVQLTNNKIMSNSTGSLKKQSYIEVQRTEGHTEGHYLSTISINIKTKDNDVVTLFSNPVQSWADRANENNGGFTLQAGTYEGRLYGYTGSYLKPIGLINEDLGVESKDNMLIHGNVMNNYEVGSAKRIYWYNTGSSEGCQILQGQDKAIDKFTTTIENLGFVYGNGYKDYEDTISVIIKDPEGITTTKDGKEIANETKNK